MPTITGRGCGEECRLTRTCDHGPYRSIPGTYAGNGDLRRCEHGRVWEATGDSVESERYTLLDVWKPLHPVWSPIRYRRAVRALAKDEAK